MDAKKYTDPARSTRRWITLGLALGGALAGAAIGIAITPLGKLVAGAPPADTANYVRNAVSFAVMGAFAAPLVAWSALRRVPLWRTVVEPLVGALSLCCSGDPKMMFLRKARPVATKAMRVS